MIMKKHSVLIGALISHFLVSPVLADDDVVSKHNWYLGAGLGITELDPDTGNTGYSVTDDRDTGFKLFAGYDFTERLSVEAFYTDLGSADIGDHPIKPDGQIDYSTMGASALWYFWRNANEDGEHQLKGLQAYVHGGLSFLDNSATVDYSQDNHVQVQYGAGVEYGLNNGTALRAGFDLYDKDAGMAFVGVLKRFGTKSRRKVPVAAVAEPAVSPVDEPAQAQPVVIPETEVSYDIDSDKDGVVDRIDECVDSPQGIKVDEKGCSIVGVELKGVNFEPQSYELNGDSRKILDDAAIWIKTRPEIQRIEVQAYTDNKGSEKYNLKLSEQRAASVKAYLVSQGVSEERLLSIGYGESQPVADNSSEQGRAKNRRVELKAATDEAAESNE